jgi:hypothetical protein
MIMSGICQKSVTYFSEQFQQSSSLMVKTMNSPVTILINCTQNPKNKNL